MDSGSTALQKEFAFQLMRGEHIFLSGAAGTGKTYFVKALVRDLLKNSKSVLLTASTGIAATQLADDVAGGVATFQRPASTLHSAALLPFSSDPDVPKFIKRGQQKLRRADVIIIDEISMLDSTTFARFLKRVSPHTGILVVGDFYQLPPVDSDDRGIPNFAFRNEHFKIFHLVELTKVYRQHEPEFLQFLERLRHGDNDRDFYQGIRDELDVRHPVLFGTRREAAHHNKAEMSKIDAPSRYAQAEATIGGADKALGWFATNTRAEQLLEIKPGMRILCIKNHQARSMLEVEDGIRGHVSLVNGSLGTLTEVGPNRPDGKPAWVIAEMDREGPVRLYPFDFEKKEFTSKKERVIYRVEQFPFVPAYGLTVHKAQGMTLDVVNIDGRRINFAAGQVYVAISRCTTRQGLRIANAGSFRAFTRPSVDEYYRTAVPLFQIVHCACGREVRLPTRDLSRRFTCATCGVALSPVRVTVTGHGR